MSVDYAIANTGTYIQGGLEITTSGPNDNGEVTVTAKLYMRRTNAYSGSTYSSGCTIGITIDGTTTSSSKQTITVAGGKQNVWQGPFLTATKKFSGASKSITISWSTTAPYASDLAGSGSTSFTVPAGYTSPSGLAVSVKSKTYNTVTLTSSLTSYGSPSSESGRGLTSMVLAKDASKTALSARRVVNNDKANSATNTVTNSSAAYDGGITIAGNTVYSIGVWATNTKKEAFLIKQNAVTTVCPPLSSLTKTAESYATAKTVSATIKWQRVTDGNALTRTLYYRTSTNGGSSYGSWTSLGTVANGTTSGTFNLTLPTSSSVIVQAKLTTSSGDSETKTLSFSTKTTHKGPNFSDFTYADTNTATIALTGDNQTMIQGQSTPKITISKDNQATGNDDIAISNYSASFSGRSGTISYSSSAETSTTLGTPTSSGTQALTVTAIDTLASSTAVSKNVTIYPWASPVINISATRENNFEDETEVSISGTYSPITINNTAKNTLAVAYRTKKTSTSEWGDWTAKTATITDSKWSVAKFTIELDNQSSWDIQARVVDAFKTQTATAQVSVGMPAFFIGSDGRVAIGQMPTSTLKDSEAGHLDISGGITVDAGGWHVDESTPGQIHLENGTANTDTYVTAQRSDTGVQVGLGVGSGGINHGIWSGVHSKWMVYGDADNVYLNGNAKGMKFASNLTVSTDTPAGWRSVFPDEGHYMIWYNTTDCFSSQPTQYGFLEIFCVGDAEVSLVWHKQASGNTYYRSGNLNGWSSPWRNNGRWYLAGNKSVTGTTSTTVALPTSNPWAIQVLASVEQTTSSSSYWCDLRALDSSGSIIQYRRNFIKVSGSSVSANGVTTGNPFAVIPMAGTNTNGTCRASSILSASGNYRSWEFASSGGTDSSYQAWVGGARQTNNTSIAKITCALPANGNISLEVWCRD